jgi:predicted permease
MMRRWVAAVRRGRLEREMDKELQFHLEQEIEANLRAGMTAGEARRAALRAIGSIALVKDECRASLGVRLVNDLQQDVRYAVRSLRRSPAFTAAAIGTLALGIGANVAIFTLVDALMLRRLPVPDAARLVSLVRQIGAQRSTHFSYPQVQLFAGRDDVFAGVAGFSDDNTVTVGSLGQQERVGAAWVSGGFYETLGLRPQAGRLLAPDDDRAGAAPVAVISDAFWTRKFERSADAIGASLIVEGTPVAIVGVTPPEFTGANVGKIDDLTLALGVLPQIEPEQESMMGPGGRWLRIMARPRPELPLTQVRAMASTVWQTSVAATVTPRMSPAARQATLSSTIDIEPAAIGTSPLREAFGRPLLVLMGMVGVLLAVACANVANLLMARASTRQREISVRRAIGAGGVRIARQLLTESAMLAAAGTLAGVVAARPFADAMVRLVAVDQGAAFLDLSLDWRMLAFAAAAAVTTTMLFGMAPAILAAREQSGPVGVLRRASNRVTPRRRLGATLVVAQTALSIILLFAAGLFVRSLWNLRTLDPGFRHEGVLLIDVDARRPGLRDDALREFYRGVLEDVRQLPGVSTASLSSVPPLTGGGISLSVALNGQSIQREEMAVNFVGPEYFRTLATKIVRGREFAEHDDAAAPPVAIVNETFVRRYMSAGTPLGQHVTLEGATELPREIVGVVEDAVYERIREAPPPTVYAPFFQNARAQQMTVEAYAPNSVDFAAEAFRARVLPGLPSSTQVRVRSFDARIESGFVRERMMAVLGVAFGVLAVLLSGVGLYGLLSYAIARRTAEIGIRLALGAEPGRIVGSVVREAGMIASIGLALGLPIGWAVARLVRSFLFGVSTGDMTASVGAALVLILTALAAAYVPARRAARVDPLEALRCE